MHTSVSQSKYSPLSMKHQGLQPCSQKPRSQLNPVHVVWYYFCSTHFNIIHLQAPRSHKCSLRFRFPTGHFYAFLTPYVLLFCHSPIPSLRLHIDTWRRRHAHCDAHPYAVASCPPVTLLIQVSLQYKQRGTLLFPCRYLVLFICRKLVVLLPLSDGPEQQVFRLLSDHSRLDPT
jgi:hypothetical protein